MSDFSIRPITITEQAMRAAQLAAETGEHQPNPHPEGTPEHLRWNAGYTRALQHHAAAEGVEGSA
jgi:hypothetical protein